MQNPWLTLPFQAVRLGWETQSVIADQMMRLAGFGRPDRKAAGDFIPEVAPLPILETPAAATPPAEAAPVKSAKPRQSGAKVKNARKQRSLATSRRRSK